MITEQEKITAALNGLSRPLGSVMKVIPYGDKWPNWYRLNYYSVVPSRNSLLTKNKIVLSRLVRVIKNGDRFIVSEVHDD